MKEREHYYYTIYAHGRWEIVKSYNQKEMKLSGYNISDITSRWRHYYDARKHIQTIHNPGRIYYINLTAVDFID